MTLSVRVNGGTGAGKRVVREPKTAWIHLCDSAPFNGGRLLDASYQRCPDCGRRRPS
jgi:hypothetical protein